MSINSEYVFLIAMDWKRPLRRYIGFRSLLMEKGLPVDMFVLTEELTEEEERQKLYGCSFMWVLSRYCIMSDDIRDELVKSVNNGKNLLITMVPSTFFGPPELNDMYLLNKLTEPFGIRYTENKIDSATMHRALLLGPECLHHPELFQGVSSVSVASPWHLEVRPAAKALITGDESCRGVSIHDRYILLRGNRLICAARSGGERSGSGKVVVIAATTFVDSDDPEWPGTIHRNRQFASNLIDWLRG